MNPILIVEDEKDISELVEYHLKQSGFSVTAVLDGASALEKVKKDRPILIILDLMLPDMDGKDICRTLKSDLSTRAIPILMLTAKGEEIDRIVGLELGADDYVTKPFSPRELVLRVKTILKKREVDQDGGKVIQIGDLLIDLDRHSVSVLKKVVQLTSIEFKLLVQLASKRGRVQTREHLLNQVWGYTYEGYARTVDTHIRRLREKLGPYGDHIETLRGSAIASGRRMNEDSIEMDPLSLFPPHSRSPRSSLLLFHSQGIPDSLLSPCPLSHDSSSLSSGEISLDTPSDDDKKGKGFGSGSPGAGGACLCRQRMERSLEGDLRGERPVEEKDRRRLEGRKSTIRRSLGG